MAKARKEMKFTQPSVDQYKRSSDTKLYAPRKHFNFKATLSCKLAYITRKDNNVIQ